MLAYVDVDMQMHIFMQMNAYACICMHGMHIPPAGRARPGGPYPFGGGAVNPGPQDINTHLSLSLSLYICIRIYIQTYVHVYRMIEIAGREEEGL